MMQRVKKASSIFKIKVRKKVYQLLGEDEEMLIYNEKNYSTPIFGSVTLKDICPNEQL